MIPFCVSFLGICPIWGPLRNCLHKISILCRTICADERLPARRFGVSLTPTVIKGLRLKGTSTNYHSIQIQSEPDGSRNAVS